MAGHKKVPVFGLRNSILVFDILEEMPTLAMMDRMGASSRLRRMYPVCSFTSSCRQDSIRLFSSSRRLSSLWYSDSVDLENISTYTYANILHRNIQPGMRIRIRSDPLIFGPPDPDPDPDPTCNNGFIKLFSS